MTDVRRWGMGPVKVEGMTADELLALPEKDLDEILFCNQPIVFRIGSAEVLAEFRRTEDTFSLDLAHIDGGGEGALPAIARMAESYARARGLTKLEWLVRATACARPNPRLRPVLERMGFEVKSLPERGECYYRLVQLRDSV